MLYREKMVVFGGLQKQVKYKYLSTFNGHSSQTKQNTLLKFDVSILHVYKIIHTIFFFKLNEWFSRFTRSKTEVDDHPINFFIFLLLINLICSPGSHEIKTVLIMYID